MLFFSSFSSTFILPCFSFGIASILFLNKFIKRDEFYNERAWYNREISDRVVKITNIDAKENRTSLEKNNVNAKALYIAYPEYFSTLDKWND